MSKIKTNPRAIEDTIKAVDGCNLSDTKKATVKKCLDKQYPSGIKIQDDNYICPKCDFSSMYLTKYCSYCGQRLFKHSYDNVEHENRYAWNIIKD